MEARTPAQLYARVAGTVLVTAGIVGFFHSAALGANILHLATGALGLLAVGCGPRTYAVGIGVLYVVIGISGFVNGSHDALVKAFPVTTLGDGLHVALGALGVAAGVTRRAT